MLIATRDRSRPNPMPPVPSGGPTMPVADARPARDLGPERRAGSSRPGRQRHRARRAPACRAGWSRSRSCASRCSSPAWSCTCGATAAGRRSATPGPGPGPQSPRATPARPPWPTAARSPSPASGMVLVQQARRHAVVLRRRPAGHGRGVSRGVRRATSRPAAPTTPVVLVSYNEARSYAETRGGRLLTTDEWDAAATTPGFHVADELFEWVESPDEQAQGRPQARQVGGPRPTRRRTTSRSGWRSSSEI